MSKLERVSQICLYAGALLLVLFMDWCWYANRYPFGNTVLKAEFFPVIYVLFLVTIIGAFVLAGYFKWKARPNYVSRRDKRKRR